MSKLERLLKFSNYRKNLKLQKINLLHLVKTMQNENLLKSDTNLVIAVKSTTIDKKLISYHRNDINITGSISVWH